MFQTVNKYILILLMMLFVPTISHAQAWSGVIDPSRAMDWTGAGVTGGIPVRNTQCGSTIAAYNGSAATINNAIGSCTQGQFVGLGSGTFNLSTGIDFTGYPNVTIRGAGANSTFLVFTGSASCDGLNADVCFGGANNAVGSELNVCDLTAPSQGAITITVTNCGFTTPLTFENLLSNGGGAIANGSHALLAASCFCFTVGMVGRTVSVTGAGPAGGLLTDTIATFVDSNNVTITGTASTTTTTGVVRVNVLPEQLSVGSVIVIDQLDELVDTGTIWNCLVDAALGISGAGNCSNAASGGGARSDGTCNGAMCYRSQQQVVTVSGISNTASGAVLTLSTPIIMPNWGSGQKPQAWYGNATASGDGIENVSIDGTSGGSFNILFMNARDSYVKGVRSINADISHARMEVANHITIQDSYFYKDQSASSGSYGSDCFTCSNPLTQNNIWQQITDSAPSSNAGSEGGVVSYNFDVKATFSAAGWMQGLNYQHASGDAFNLWEGNIINGYVADNVHGTHNFETLNREVISGNQTDCNGTCVAQTIPLNIYAGSRYFNIIGGAYGIPTYHINYAYLAPASNGGRVGGADLTVYMIGYTGNEGGTDTAVNGFCINQACGSTVDYDTQASATMMRWGNYDVVNAASVFTSGEVPSGVSPYGNALPGSHTIAPSFYASWTRATACGTGNTFQKNPTTNLCSPFPETGPDVTGGDLQFCNGGTYNYSLVYSALSSPCTGGTVTAIYGGTANSNPAMRCALGIMGIPPDGSGAVKAFDPYGSCYENDPVAAAGGGKIPGGGKLPGGTIFR